MSGSESSSTFDESSYGCPEYEIEEECGEKTSQNESEPTYAIKDEFILDDMAYTDEPLEDDSWVEQYLRRQEEYVRENEELSLRLNEQTPVNSW